MNDVERKEWISNLKEGNKVANEHYNTWRGSYYQIYTVKKITPTGKIRLDNGVLLNSNGRYYNRDVWGSGEDYNIEPVTDEILNSIKTRKIKNKLRSNIESIFKDYNLMGMSVEDLKAINNILEKYVDKEED